MSEPDQIVNAPADASPVRWGLGDAAAGWLLGILGGVLAGSLAVVLSGIDADADLPMGWFAVAQAGLWAGLLGVPLFVARAKGNGARRDFGLFAQWRDLRGLGIGLAMQLIVVPLLYWPIFNLFDVSSEKLEEPARELTDQANGPVGVVLLVILVGFGAPVVEEIFYRGLVQRSIANRWGAWPGILGSAWWFGLSHFQLLQLPALVVLGVVLAYMTDRTGRLGPAIFTHIAFNMVTVVFLVAS